MIPQVPVCAEMGTLEASVRSVSIPPCVQSINKCVNRLCFSPADLDPCGHTQPCRNGGVCRNAPGTGGGYACNCTGTGFEGTNCKQQGDAYIGFMQSSVHAQCVIGLVV